MHHGNGTQACLARVVPHQVQYALHTPLSEGSMTFPAFHPWLDDDDRDNLLFARHGFLSVDVVPHFPQAWVLIALYSLRT